MTDFPPPGSNFPPPGSNFPPPPPSSGSGGYGAPPPGYSSTYGSDQPAPMTPVPYAGIGARFGALLIDGVLTALFIIPAIIVLLNGPTTINTCRVDDDGGRIFGGDGGRLAFCEDPTGGTIAAAILLGIAGLVAVALYFTLQIGRTGQTVGKRATGVRVIDAHSGLPIGNGRAFGRYFFATLISGPICWLGYLWALWDDRKQTWHDKVATTVVVKA